MAVSRSALAAILGGFLLAAPLAAQTGTGNISGHVVDSASKQPLSAVSIRIAGTPNGVLTQNDGSYIIRGVQPGTVQLRATRIGFAAASQPVTVLAGQTVTADFALSARAAVLSDVVVTGYGSQRREAITGSVSTVDATQANVGVVSNPTQLVQGRVAGVSITANNGEPGGGVQMRVRGGTSIQASNDPLYVVDGVPLQNETTVADARIEGVNKALARNPLNSINPNDIESITVLKDASATAIYGSRGANGVVLITTKHGRPNASGVEYDTYVAAAKEARSLDFLTGDQYRAFVNDQVSKGKLPASQQALNGTANTNWEDALMHTGVTSSHNVAFSGGSQQTTYRASLNYFDQQGVVIGNGLKRYQGRVNGKTTALDGKVNIDLNLTASRVNNVYLAMENGGGFTGGVFTNMAIYNPTLPIFRLDSATNQQVYYEMGAGAQSVRNPVALANQIVDRSPENRVLGNLTGTVQLLPMLMSTTTVGTDYTSSVRQTYVPRSNPLGAALNGIASQSERSLQNINFQQLLTATPSLGASHELEVLGGYEFSRFENDGFQAVMQGFITDAFQFNNLGAGTQAGSPTPTSYLQTSRLVSFFGRANYGFKSKYYLTGVVRRDGSSRLAEGHKWSVFPALSGSWRINQEGFMQGSRFSTLALRAGWGRQGNQAVQPYGTQLLLRTDAGARYPFGSTITTGLSAAQVENPDLKWETSEQTNVGLDWGIKNDRISGVIDVYQKTTKDLLLTVPVPQPAVVSTQLQNIGSVRNRGFEMTLDGRLIENGDRSLTSGLVLSVERNSIVNLGDAPFIITGSVFGQGQSGRFAQRLIPGQPLGTFWGPKFLRVDDKGQQVFQCLKARTGCTNGETTAPSGDDEMIIGNANPKFSLGLRSNASAGKFDASWLWRGEFGRTVFNNTALVYSTKSNAKSSRNFLAAALDDPTGIDEPAIYSSRWLENGRFIRLQNATIGYTFALPGALGGGRSTRVYLSGDNLLLFTPYSGYDPEVFTDAGIATRGIDYLTYPRARTFTVGAHVGF
ncbi:MAG TPA: SusC/RagA family TonB-linked outer membrane protein [Gemmatimonadaceae bacterium]|jgi:iron complex outermembrane receptor protein|nr:SusC/RagA family TonB-linked outer membrane protein [Gemmatimonadaceae bacterium]